MHNDASEFLEIRVCTYMCISLQCALSDFTNLHVLFHCADVGTIIIV